MYMNSLVFFITVTRKIKFVTIEHVTSTSKKTIMKCVSAVIDFYKCKGFKIINVLGDNKFLYLEEYLDNKYNIEYNTLSVNEHVGEIEHMIRMVK